jgi:diguanylate cyclase (GGDEF)-like protein/PAS domain S-box-containing protein
MMLKKIEKNGLVIISIAASMVYWYFDTLYPSQLISRVFTSFLFVAYGFFTQYLTNSYAEQRDIEAKYHDLVDHIRDGVYRLNKDGHFTFANKVILDSSGIPPENFHDFHYLDIVAPEDHESARKHFEKVMKDEKAATHELKYKTADGNLRVMEINTTPIYGQGGMVGLQSISRDVTARRRMEEALQETRETLQILFQASPTAIITLDLQEKVTLWNPAAEHAFGWHEAEVLGRSLPFILQDKRNEYLALREGVLGGQSFTGIELFCSKKDGSPIDISFSMAPLRNAAGNIVGMMSTCVDITDRRRMEEEIREMSMRDQLTGLYNRRGFITLAEQQLKTVNRTKRLMTLTFIDVDEMKQINDTMGHDEGDKALIDTANIIRQTLREADIIARIGGDEFAIVATEITELNPDAFSTRLQQNINEFNAKECRPYKIAMSWGTAVYDPAFPASLDELMSAADELMYQRKGQNKHMVQNLKPDLL